jgi:cytosine/adenosine deaminase-related metal-dependent hydrolase
MKSQRETIYRARWIFPMRAAPIHDGRLRVVGGKIAEVGSAREIGGSASDTLDLGDVALLPRLVNAHTHLEFSDCESAIGRPGIALADWIGQVIASRGQASAEDRRNAIRSGLAESVAGGVGLIGDVATTPSEYPGPMDAFVVSFAEVLGLSAERAEQRYEAAEQHAASLSHRRLLRFGVSPHAPYSTPLSLVRRCVDLASASGSPVAMHVAESPLERQLVESGSGRFAEALRGAGLWRDGLFPWPDRHPLIELIARLAEAPRALLIHGNDLNADEICAIADHDQLSVVYCPRTHHFFGYPPHPVQELLKAGVRVALGTDSRASNPDLSLWKEVQFLLLHRPDLDPQAILRMATLSGADALLGSGSKFGTIAPGSGGIDSLVAVATQGKSLNQVWGDFADGELLCTELL